MPSRKMLQEMQEAARSGRPYRWPNTPADRAQRTKRVLERIEREGLVGHAVWLDWPYKLHRIHGRGNSVRLELYHLDDDPAESHNLADAQPERVAQMRKELEAWQQSVVASLKGEDYKLDQN